MTTPSRDTCANCKFGLVNVLVPVGAPHNAPPKTALCCHRSAPAAVTNPAPGEVAHPSQAGERWVLHAWHHARWPIVQPDDWCGSFEAKGAAS